MTARARWWFAPAPPARLAILRVLIGAYALHYLHGRRRMLQRVGAGDPALFAPVGIVAALKRPVSPVALRAALDATETANVAFILGWRHRVTGPTFAALLLAVLTYRNSWSMIYHNDNVLVLHVVVLGASPGRRRPVTGLPPCPASAGRRSLRLADPADELRVRVDVLPRGGRQAQGPAGAPLGQRRGAACAGRRRRAAQGAARCGCPAR